MSNNNKGKRDGVCARTVCDQEAKHYHRYNGKYYCTICADAIQSHENNQVNPWRIFDEFYKSPKIHK